MAKGLECVNMAKGCEVIQYCNYADSVLITIFSYQYLKFKILVWVLFLSRFHFLFSGNIDRVTGIWDLLKFL